MKRWNMFLDIPEGKSGAYRIVHDHKPPGTVYPTSNLRTLILGRQPRANLQFANATRWHYLRHGKRDVWMSDLPIEQVQMDNCLKGMKGHVLVGGLGLGYAAQRLSLRNSVTKVTVVERSPEVIGLVHPYLRKNKKIHMVCTDLFRFLRRTKRMFDFAMYDVWADDGLGTFMQTVVPLRQLSVGVVPDDHLVCWNEDVMQGQLVMGLQTKIMAPLLNPKDMSAQEIYELLARYRGNAYLDWCVPFFRWVTNKNPDMNHMTAAAQPYSKICGHPNWENQWSQIQKQFE